MDKAFDDMMRQMDVFAGIGQALSTDDGVWFFEDLPNRQARRVERQRVNTATGTGVPELDQLLGGGLDLGQLGIWMAYSKAGKTTWMVNLGRVAVRAHFRNVAHFFFEGTHEQIGNRYDASFSRELYTAVQTGNIDSRRYSDLYAEYQYFRRKLYLQGFTQGWSYSVLDIWESLERLKRQHGWSPDVVIVDYADLLKGRETHDSEWDSNASAYRDLKTLSTKGRGFAIWTAAQAKKPKDDGYDMRQHLLKSSDLGGRYEKVKVADFVASLNATLEERTVLRRMRIWVEAVRDHPGGREIIVPCDFDRMVLGAGAGAEPTVLGSAGPAGLPPGSPGLGYRQLRPGPT